MSLLDTKRKKVMFTIALSVAIIVGLAWFTLIFQKKLIIEMSETVQKEKLDAFVHQEKKDKILKLKKELDDIEIQKKEMEAMLPKKDGVVPVLQSLEKIAFETSSTIKIDAVDISKLKIGQAKKPVKKQEDEEIAKKESATSSQDDEKEEKPSQDDLAKIRKFPAFNLTITGNYSSLIDFMDKMDSLPYFIRVLIIDLAYYDKDKNQMSSGGTVFAPSLPSTDQSEENKEKGVKMTLLIVIYIND